MFNSKQELRNWVKATRKTYSNCSNILVEKLRETELYKSSKNIMIFYPLDGEINLLSLLDDVDKKFYLPKISGKDLLCCCYSKGDELCESCFKTNEPLTNPCDKLLIDLVIVPALCCDINNYRLGYGGGFYDRFLEDFRGNTICCIPKKYLIETVFPENHDKKIDLIITD